VQLVADANDDADGGTRFDLARGTERALEIRSRIP
jgi:hypothetical protein